MWDGWKDFIARRVFHPLTGMKLGDWWSLLQDQQFAIALDQSPRALVQTLVCVSNSILARREDARFGRQVETTTVLPPLFILGHYRSGTTHLHNLLALDPRFAAPTFFQVLNPHTFLTTEKWAGPVSDRLMIRRRYQDEMDLASGIPGEDEVALGTMTGLSPYLGWYFPRGLEEFNRYLTFQDVPELLVLKWRQAFVMFLKKLTFRHGRPLLLKSPPHTARIDLILDLFPEARFIHISRNPYEVFRSMRHTIRSVHPVFKFQNFPPPDSDESILQGYTRMYDAYFDQRKHIPVDRFVEVSFEELEVDPIGVVETIYRSLGLEGIDDLRPRLKAYLGSIAGYRKNLLEELPEPLRRRIVEAWSRSFDEWGYQR